jgi:hypothetical protein
VTAAVPARARRIWAAARAAPLRLALRLGILLRSRRLLGHQRGGKQRRERDDEEPLRHD